MRILLLGGTGESIELAAGLVGRRHKVTTALAGRTRNPRKPQGALHLGGFGGAEGLAKFLGENRFEYLVDATHPFAVQISANAVRAAANAGVPLLRLERAAWPEPSRTRWEHVVDEEAAAVALPESATVLLTTGRQRLSAFLARHDCRFVLRSIEAPDLALPANFALRTDRPPFTLHDELALMRRFGFSHLVAKNSGGGQTAAKLEAAFLLKIKVVMIDRPPLAPTQTVTTVEAALAVIDQLPAPARRLFFFP
ncbi:MAG TPA: cobalt-precorrin-6A reductase [Devosiaceae bacterium]|nr:cobalt-precorrin-6A reductase [Devosiaceae bacterium]